MIDKRLVLLYFLGVISDVFGVLTNPLPQNKAVINAATRITFNCSSTRGSSFISWSFAPVGGSSPILITNAANVIATDAYELSQTGSNDNNLIIKTVNESLAGTYFCSEPGIGASFASAQLIVYNSDPFCTANVSSMNPLYQGQSVQMSCTFNYTANSSYVSVNMLWSSGGSSLAESPPVITTTGNLTTAVSIINQVVGYSSPFPVYQCNSSFSINGSTAQAATNAPDYTNTTKPFQSPIYVYYFNPNCSINGAKSGDTVYQGLSISCQADANPPPSYSWLDVSSGNRTNTSSFEILKNGTYNCTASNSVSSCQLSIYVTTIAPTTTSTTTTSTTTFVPTLIPSLTPQTDSKGSQSPGAAPSSQGRDGLTEEQKNIIIGVVVGVGGAIVILLIIIICCCIIKKKRSERYKEDRNLKPMTDYPPPYDGRIGPQRNFEPDVVDYSPANYTEPSRSSYGSSPSSPYVVDDGLNYAKIQLDNQPRSRQPLQVQDNSNYVDVTLA